MKKYKFRHYLFADKVSIVLLIVTIGLLINYFITGYDVSAFLAIVILNMVFNIVEKARFFKKLDESISNENIYGIQIREKLGLKD